ncbi:ATP-binding protein [Actinophytocola sp. NPDC049390]|uniref:ATP-binding protein n=1 Tax=Actinophytocola sp. NPDC049390 TaxID=3363894 RepID=UPI0037ADD63A
MTLPFADQVALIIPTADEPPPDEVRCWVQDNLAAVPPVPRLHAALVTEELVGNARAHGLPPYVLRIAVDPQRRALRVFVEDCAAHSGGRWQSGGGLALVDGLSRGWGVERRASAKTVWAEVGL